MLSMQSLDILFDLTEIKLNSIIVQDKEDLREFNKLKNCRRELLDEINERNAARRHSRQQKVI